MKLNRLLAAMSAAGLMAMVGPAQASITFQFNPLGGGTGAGLINGAGIIDQAPGNANALNGAGPPGPPVALGTVITDLYQANLGSVQALSTAGLSAMVLAAISSPSWRRSLKWLSGPASRLWVAVRSLRRTCFW